MAAAFALTVIVNQQAALRLMRLPDNRGDRSQARQTTPGKFTRRVIALVRHRLADVVVIPARGAVGLQCIIGTQIYGSGEADIPTMTSDWVIADI